ncbi:hypothetical protein Fmac_018953 [Flemingia macrophylla]|uniref:Uncharacterized protein n=1 Tax=Flemingia macrophylla TaxID=520843 RepID=A0ABD1M6I6_9FABA
MDKPSSSLNKKRSKKSAKAKASGKIKKSRKHKSKKVRRREVSFSSSDYDDSKSLETLASSSSEDSYRGRRKDRSLMRKDVKNRKRKSRGRSYSRDSSEDSHRARKRKKAKRKKPTKKKKIRREASVDSFSSRSLSCPTCQDGSASGDDSQKKKRKNGRDVVRKKPLKKKKIRREASVDSFSSRSHSCPTCQDGSASSDDSQYKSHRGRSERNKKDRRSGNKKSSRYRARSCSSSNPYSENSYEVTKEKYVGEKNSRWLRSVITVTKEAEEYGDLCRNETKEEIVDDHDYPCRSNDSNDGGTKRDLDHHTLLTAEEKLGIEDEAVDMDAGLNFAEPKLRDRSYNDSNNLKAYSAGTSKSMKETSETYGANVSDIDLELILRQRALENLRKFRGEIQSSADAPDKKNKIVSQVEQPITDKHELVQGKFVVNGAAVGTEFNKPTPGEETNLPVGRRSFIACSRNNENILNMDKDVSGSAKCHLARTPDNPSGTVTESTIFNTTNLEFTQQTQKSGNDSLLTSASHELTNSKFPMSEGDVERNAAKTTEAASQSINESGRDDASSVENKSGVLQNETNQGSQFEQKTMTVMRGGEMVQVSPWLATRSISLRKSLLWLEGNLSDDLLSALLVKKRLLLCLSCLTNEKGRDVCKKV